MCANCNLQTGNIYLQNLHGVDSINVNLAIKIFRS